MATEIYSKGKYVIFFTLNPDLEKRKTDKGKIQYLDAYGKPLSAVRKATKYEKNIITGLENGTLKYPSGKPVDPSVGIGIDKTVIKKSNEEEIEEKAKQKKSESEKSADNKGGAKSVNETQWKDIKVVYIGTSVTGPQTPETDAAVQAEQKATEKVLKGPDGYGKVVFMPTVYNASKNNMVKLYENIQKEQVK